MNTPIAVVAGATRGAGRGIARGLGEIGAIVYCTGRSTAGNPSPYSRSETIEETADLVTRAGGTGVPVRVDHTVEDEVHKLFERIEREHNNLDLLVCSVAGEDPRQVADQPFWKSDLTQAPEILKHTVISHVLTAKHAAKLMVKNARGLIVEVTEGDIPGMASGNILSDIQKTCHKSLAWRMANELREHGVTAMAITPGFLRSEVVLDHFGVTEPNWKEGGKQDKHFLASESPLFVGRVVAALLGDPDIAARAGDLTSSWELAAEFNIDDEDGSRPDWGRHMTEHVVPEIPWYRNLLERQVEWLERVAARGRTYLNTERLS